MNGTRYIRLAASLALFVALTRYLWAEPPPVTGREPRISFAGDIQPLLAKNCISCHGSDKQKGGLRFDRRREALAGGDSGAAIIPKKPDDSPLIQRISSTDPELRMPPKGERLSASEIESLRRWIAQGADWPEDGSSQAETWWSFAPLHSPPIPASATASGNEIDRFIRASLAAQGLQPSGSADRRTLIRRLYFDLLGLPPKPEEIDQFVADPSPEAYGKLVDRLLASPHYGERWARHWLDVTHFGETHGYDKDKPRPNAWPYRDYVIRSFNEDKPFDRFIREQVAGDVLYAGSRDGFEALGFLAAGPWDFIGHAEVPESKIDGKIARHLDRDDMVANTISTFLGLTVHCAQCHNHKFDPIPQEEYYQLQSVFAAIDRADQPYDADPETSRQRKDLTNAAETARRKIAELEAQARARAGEPLKQLDKALSEAKAAKPGLRPEYGYHSEISPKADEFKWVQVDLGQPLAIASVVLRPCFDDFNRIGPGFGFPRRFKVELSDDPKFESGVLLLKDHMAEDFPNPGTGPVAIPVGQAVGRYVRVTATKLAARMPDDFIFALAELEAIDASGANRAAKAEVTAKDSIEAPARWRKLNLTDGIFPPPPRNASKSVAELTRERDSLIRAAMPADAAQSLEAARADLEGSQSALKKLPAPRMVYIGAVHSGSGAFAGTGAQGGRPRPIRILPRGDVTKPGKEVAPGALSAIAGLSAKFDLAAENREGDRRAALAHWLSHRDNPLPWRVMANRIWQYHFGRGLVDTPNDFGKMGQLPTHPALLDWLAAQLRDYQSIKQLHRLIVMSETYRQTSASDPMADAKDADNRWLWRQNRRKLEAEAVRDSILQAAGKLDLTMGGPSFQDFVIEKPEHSPHYEYHLFDPENSKGHRRAVYRFIVRSKQQPFLASLDCADPSLSVEKRNQTLTPQQALSLLNNSLTVAMARHFSRRVEPLAEDDAGRIAKAFEIAIGRRPVESELQPLLAYVREHGLANGCRVILNLNEFVFVD